MLLPEEAIARRDILTEQVPYSRTPLKYWSFMYLDCVTVQCTLLSVLFEFPFTSSHRYHPPIFSLLLRRMSSKRRRSRLLHCSTKDDDEAVIPQKLQQRTSSPGNAGDDKEMEAAAAKAIDDAQHIVLPLLGNGGDGKEEEGKECLED